MKINENQWKSMEIIENQWKSMKINGNQFGRPDHLFLARPTPKVPSEALSRTFFDRLDIKFDAIDMINTLGTSIPRHRWHNCKITPPEQKITFFFELCSLGLTQPQIPTQEWNLLFFTLCYHTRISCLNLSLGLSIAGDVQPCVTAATSRSTALGRPARSRRRAG